MGAADRDPGPQVRRRVRVTLRLELDPGEHSERSAHGGVAALCGAGDERRHAGGDAWHSGPAEDEASQPGDREGGDSGHGEEHHGFERERDEDQGQGQGTAAWGDGSRMQGWFLGQLTDPSGQGMRNQAAPPKCQGSWCLEIA